MITENYLKISTQWLSESLEMKLVGKFLVYTFFLELIIIISSEKNFFSAIGKELNRRPRKGGHRTHPKPKKTKPLTLENVGNEKTRKALERDLQEEKGCREAVAMLQPEFSGIIPSQYP